jgi:alanyl-tRNA synthetase
LDKSRLYVTVFREDNEAEALWQKVAGVPKDRIFRLDEADNFWQMGDTGPCGPCSEIHFDLGREAAEPGREEEKFPLDGGGRFVEIWNLVFMQFDRSTEGVLTPLPRPSIDTGMGLERLAAVMQDKLSNFETDLLRPIIDYAARLFKVEYGRDERTNVVLRICADHARAAAFLVNDGVIPSNDGRGYVLRKIMRRAMRNARMAGVQEPFLHKMTRFVAEFMKAAYPEMLESADRVARVVKEEEHRYATTFQVAERVFHDEAKTAQGGVLSGTAAFKLYDTFGLALDEQEEMAREFGLQIDRCGFDTEMERQRERARASWKGGEKAQVAPVYNELLSEGRTRFLGYEGTEFDSCIVRGIMVDQRLVEGIEAGAKAELVLDQTPFYAEAGGQVGDRGTLYRKSTGEKVADVETTYAAVPGLTVHRILATGEIRPGDTLTARVESAERRATMRNHTATHLLHAALRTVLGTHVKQAGSIVEPARLRFDFTHYAPVSAEEISEIERLMNEQILINAEVQTDVMPIDQALATGAMALFGEKYGDTVRVVSVPGFSRELCGGTHVHRTGDIGLCKVVSEGSISAGVRRIEAISGEGALRRFQEAASSLQRITESVRGSEADVVEQVERLTAQQKALERQLDQMKTRLAQAQVSELEQSARVLKGVKVVSARVEGMDRQQLRTLADALRNKWKTGIVVLATAQDSNVAILSAVTKDLTLKVHANKLIGPVASAVGGRSGGRPDLAEGGGTDPSGLQSALESIYAAVEGML